MKMRCILLAILLLISSAESKALAPPSDAGSAVAVAASPNTPSVAAAVILPGRIESCAINPPLSLITAHSGASQQGGDYVLQSSASSSSGKAVLIAYSSTGNASAEPTAYVVDQLNLSPAGVRSTTGQAEKVYQQEPIGTAVRLVPKPGDFSVCRYGVPLPPEAVSILRNSPEMAQKRFHATAVAFTSISDIFGLEGEPSIRLRLSSIPTDAEILIGGLRQNARTDTILDIATSDIPNVLLEKAGFEPCGYRDWATSQERSSKTVLNASCQLRPRKAKRK